MKLTLDLHVHSDASFDGRMSVRQIALLAKARGIDGVAICDHDVVYTGPTEVEGVLIIPGAEFSTEHGHLLGLFLTAPIQYTTWKETVQAIHDQGGITVLAHPYQNKRSGSLEPFRPILNDIDAVETWNSRANRKYPHANDNAFIMALLRNKLSTGGSDAHVPQEVGRGFLTVDVEERTLAAVKAQILGGGFLFRHQHPVVQAAQAQRPASQLLQQLHQVFVHLSGQHHLDDIHGFRVRIAHTVDKFAFLADFLQHRADLRTAAVN